MQISSGDGSDVQAERFEGVRAGARTPGRTPWADVPEATAATPAAPATRASGSSAGGAADHHLASPPRAAMVVGSVWPQDADRMALPWLDVPDAAAATAGLASPDRLRGFVTTLTEAIAAATVAHVRDAARAGEPMDPSLWEGLGGVLWALAETGVTVSEELREALVSAVRTAPRPGLGLATGLSGRALALDKLGSRSDAAALWRALDLAPLGGLGVTVADGLPGVGLALLERSHRAHALEAITDVHTIAAMLTPKLRDGRLPGRPGLMHGASGAALFLLQAYELTDDETLLEPVAGALRHDLNLLGWGPPQGRPFRPRPRWTTPGTLSEGSIGVAVALHRAVAHLDDPWVAEARDAIVAAAQSQLIERPGLSRGRGSAVLAVQHLLARPWETADERLARVRPFLQPLTLAAAPGVAAPTGMAALSVRSGAAGVMLALAHLTTAGDRRVPFLW
ncbi:hypothetical protein [Georgenia sp. AZ-5]|uniref:hypothetical protein n=1 Tax=Georgenia sp. AZ-5 TaxID=3367526 RepID=UPI0037552717